MIKQRWQNLSLREQQLLAISSMILLPVLLYLFVLSPLYNNVANLKQEVSSEQKLVNWMQIEINQIKNFPTTNERQSQTLTSDNFSNFVLSSLQTKNLKQYLQSGDNQPSSNTQMIKFKAVPFDNLMDWITLLWQQYQIKTIRLDVSADHVKGLVAANMAVSLPVKSQIS